MNNQDFIPETAASQLAGVSAATLARFVEAGYLRVQNDNHGFRNYSKSEICKLFAIDAENPEQDAYLVASIDVLEDESNPNEVFEHENNIDEQEKVYWADTVSPEEDLPAKEASLPEQTPSEDSVKDKAEIIRLRNITMMQDKVLDIREKEIEELKKERDWLKTRVEKLEEKGERDQLLLLAETQTIKRLVNLAHQKKPSTIRLAMEWLGIVPQDKTSDLEVTKPKVIES